MLRVRGAAGGERGTPAANRMEIERIAVGRIQRRHRAWQCLLDLEVFSHGFGARCGVVDELPPRETEEKLEKRLRSRPLARTIHEFAP